MYLFALHVSYWYWWFYFMLSYMFPCGRNWCAPLSFWSTYAQQDISAHVQCDQHVVEVAFWHGDRMLLLNSLLVRGNHLLELDYIRLAFLTHRVLKDTLQKSGAMLAMTTLTSSFKSRTYLPNISVSWSGYLETRWEPNSSIIKRQSMAAARLSC